MEEKKTSGKASVDILAKLLQYKQNFCVKERFLSSAISMTQCQHLWGLRRQDARPNSGSAQEQQLRWSYKISKSMGRRLVTDLKEPQGTLAYWKLWEVLQKTNNKTHTNLVLPKQDLLLKQNPFLPYSLFWALHSECGHFVTPASHTTPGSGSVC